MLEPTPDEVPWYMQHVRTGSGGTTAAFDPDKSMGAGLAPGSNSEVAVMTENGLVTVPYDVALRMQDDGSIVYSDHWKSEDESE